MQVIFISINFTSLSEKMFPDQTTREITYMEPMLSMITMSQNHGQKLWAIP